MRPSIAIIDSDASARHSLASMLAQLNVEVQGFDSAESYLGQSGANKSFACVIVAVTLSGISGMQLLKQIRASDSQLPVILFAAESDVAIAVDAMRNGATDFIERSQLDIALLRRVAQLLKNADDVVAAKRLAPL